MNKVRDKSYQKKEESSAAENEDGRTTEGNSMAESVHSSSLDNSNHKNKYKRSSSQI